MLSIITRVFAILFCLSVAEPAEATLISRLDGAAAYDDVLKITWLTDADLSGHGKWQNQLDWVSSLNSATHLGFNDWRLASISTASPTTSVVKCGDSATTAQDCADAGNELGYMHYHNMDGGKNTGDQTVDGVLLTDVQTYYWSGTEYNANNAWHFNFFTGNQFKGLKGNAGRYGWAVRSGDVAAVPEPGTAVLMGAGLAVLMGFGRCKRRR